MRSSNICKITRKYFSGKCVKGTAKNSEKCVKTVLIFSEKCVFRQKSNGKADEVFVKSLFFKTNKITLTSSP